MSLGGFQEKELQINILTHINALVKNWDWINLLIKTLLFMVSTRRLKTIQIFIGRN